MLLLEIALTVAAWRRGWGMRALVPTGTAFAIGFLMALGGNQSGTRPLALVLELLLICALAHMSRTTPARRGVDHPITTEGEAATGS